MFGYIAINKAEMKFKDYDMYQSYYCGLCKRLKECYGRRGQITLSYDMTFLIVLLTGLYEPETEIDTVNCIAHPLEKHTARTNIFSDYAADMNLILTYYKCKDDWADEKKILQLIYAKFLEKGDKEAENAYFEKSQKILSLLKQLSEWEKAGEKDIDRMSGCFGRIMEEIFVYRQDNWEPVLRRMGFYLGKFIYLLDAYDDVEKDAETGNYNPFSEEYIMEGFEEHVRQLLLMMLSEACREFEKLPIIRYADILRNILYSGVWSRFQAVSVKRREEQEKNHVRSI